MSRFFSVTNTEEFDLIAIICETNMTADVKTCESFSENYEVLTKDCTLDLCKEQSGGGFLLVTNNIFSGGIVNTDLLDNTFLN